MIALAGSAWSYVVAPRISIRDFDPSQPVGETMQIERITYVKHSPICVDTIGGRVTLCWAMRHESMAREDADTRVQTLLRSRDIQESANAVLRGFLRAAPPTASRC